VRDVPVIRVDPHAIIAFRRVMEPFGWLSNMSQHAVTCERGLVWDGGW